MYFNFPVSEATVDYAISRILTLEESNPQKIYLVLNSPGGSVMAGIRFIGFLRQFHNIDTVSFFAASMASGIVEGNSGIRYVTPTGTLMFHRASVGLEGQIGSGEFESRLQYIKDIVLELERQDAKRMHISLSKFKHLIKDELYEVGSNAIGSSADEVAIITCSPELMTHMTPVTIGGVKVGSYISCPYINKIEQEQGSAEQKLLEGFKEKEDKK